MPSWRRRSRAGEGEELAKKKEEQLQKKRIREEVLMKKVEATTNRAAKAGGKKHNTRSVATKDHLLPQWTLSQYPLVLVALPLPSRIRKNSGETDTMC